MNILDSIFGGFFIVSLGFFVGIPVGLMYMEPMSHKIIYLILVMTCISIFIIGVTRRKKVIGKLLIIISLVSWTFLSLVGLGTIY